MNIPSKEYAAWHKQASEQIDMSAICAGIHTLGKDKIKSIDLYFYAPDKRATDLTNKAESIMDLLVDNKIIEDDNWWIVTDLGLHFRGLDKENPRCEVEININE